MPQFPLFPGGSSLRSTTPYGFPDSLLESFRRDLCDAQERVAILSPFLSKGQRTRIENQIKSHELRMQERRLEVENMRLGAFPAPELLNMVVVTKA